MKKQILFLSALLALGFSGCSNEENIETGNSEEIRVPVTFDIGTETKAVDENYMKEVDLYLFDAEGKFVNVQETHLDQQSTGSITFPKKGAYTVEAIANETPKLNLTAGSSTYEDFKAQTTVYTNAKADKLQMRDVQTATLSNANPRPHLYFKMRRLVSRINIVNEVPDFVLTKATLQNAMAKSFFYINEEEMANYWDLTETETKEATAFTAAADGKTYYSVFYIYECPFDKCNLSLDVQGTIDGVEHNVPTLGKDAFIGNHQPVRRNTQYTVTLKEVDGAIVATLTVSDWEEGEKLNDAEVTPEGVSLEVEVSTVEDENAADYVLATEAEREVKNLNFYLFNADGVLENAYINVKDCAWTPSNQGNGKKVKLTNILTTGAKTLYVVANTEGNATLDVTEGATKATEFEALMATKAGNALACPLLMFKKVEIAAEGWSEEGVATAAAVLERVAARIDLRVNKASGFVPESIQLVGANGVSYVIAETPAAGSTTTLEKSGLAGTTEGDYLVYKQLFYTYSIANTEGMYLLLKGTQTFGDASAEAVYKKPLSEMTGFDKIAHNTCYIITIDDVDLPASMTSWGGNVGGEPEQPGK